MLTRMVVLVSLAVLLMTPLGLVGCRGPITPPMPEFIIGFLGDFTGLASFAETQTYKGIQDYLRKAKKENLIPEWYGIRLIDYDTRSEFDRISAGYTWLKSYSKTYGEILVVLLDPSFQERMTEHFEEDKIICFGAMTSPMVAVNDWVYNLMPSWTWQAEFLWQWICDRWDYEEMGRAPKVGLVGVFGAVAVARAQERLEELQELQPGKIESKVERVSSEAVTFAAEVDRLKDCDFIVPYLYGLPLATFVREAIEGGYDGQFISGLDVFTGFWDLVRAAIQPDKLDGTLCFTAFPYWTDDLPFIAECKETLLKYRPDEAKLHMGNAGYIIGYGMGIVLTDAIKRAAEKVGAENVDGTDLHNALAETDMSVQGWGNPWNFPENLHCLWRMQRMYEYRAAGDTWFAISDWFVSPSGV